MEFSAAKKGRIPDITLQCLQHLRHHLPTVTISVEVEKPDRKGLQDLAALADVVFYSKSWARVCIPTTHRAVSHSLLMRCDEGEWLRIRRGVLTRSSSFGFESVSKTGLLFVRALFP